MRKTKTRGRDSRRGPSFKLKGRHRRYHVRLTWEGGTQVCVVSAPSPEAAAVVAALEERAPAYFGALVKVQTWVVHEEPAR